MRPKTNIRTWIRFAVVALLVGSVLWVVSAQGEQKQVGTGPTAQATPEQASNMAGVLAVIANHLALRPQSPQDFSQVSGERCVNFEFPHGAHMTHYATVWP